MSKNTPILLTLIASTTLFFTGCVERGYELTVTQKTHTVTAQMTRDIRKKDNRSQQAHMLKMKTKVKEEALREERQNAYEVAMRQQQAKSLEAQRVQQKIALQNQQRAQTQKTLENQKRAQEQMMLNDQRKVQKQRVLAEQQKAQEKKRQAMQVAQRKQLQKPTVRKSIAKPKKFIADTKLNTIEESKPTYTFTTQALKFKKVNKIYQKFGTSEINGHVVYMKKTGAEVKLHDTKIYLLPVSAKLDNWYNNYYLENKDNTQTTTVAYVNSVNLNINSNFEFFGVAQGDYYIIIEASVPARISKNKKVYIAKKVNVGKYQKVMAVFSKKL